MSMKGMDKVFATLNEYGITVDRNHGRDTFTLSIEHEGLRAEKVVTGRLFAESRQPAALLTMMASALLHEVGLTPDDARAEFSGHARTASRKKAPALPRTVIQTVPCDVCGAEANVTGRYADFCLPCYRVGEKVSGKQEDRPGIIRAMRESQPSLYARLAHEGAR